MVKIRILFRYFILSKALLGLIQLVHAQELPWIIPQIKIKDASNSEFIVPMKSFTLYYSKEISTFIGTIANPFFANRPIQSGVTQNIFNSNVAFIKKLKNEKENPPKPMTLAETIKQQPPQQTKVPIIPQGLATIA